MKKKKKVRKCVAVAALSLEASTAICWRNVLESWERKYKDKEVPEGWRACEESPGRLS